MASFIPEHIISEIQNRVDIVDVISEVVILKKQGRNYFGLCPFHSDKDPSFSVSPEKGIFYCFGCGVGGNAFNFLMQLNGYSFPQAARILAARCGVQIPEARLSPEQKRQLDEKTQLLRVNALAADFFHRALLNGNANARALAYLKGRGFSDDIVKRCKLGLAPDGWRHLTSFFQREKIPIDWVARAGLVVARKNGTGHYDRFRNRIMFPIADMGGKIIGFGGRVMDDALPKYLNTPETPVYKKSQSLYGIHIAKSKCRADETVIIVEGYLDLLALYQGGVENAAATLGTALTDAHVRMLRGCIGQNGKAILVYDSDQAGINAARRSIAVFERGHVDARVLVLPAGHDPDSYIHKHGHESFMRGVGAARNMISFLMDTAVSRHGLSVEGKRRILDEMIGPLAAVDDAIKRSLYIKELAERLELAIDENAILEKVKAHLRSGPNQGSRWRHPDRRGPMMGAPNEPPRGDEPETAMGKFERRIIAMMLQFPDITPEIEKRHLPDFFENKTLAHLGNFILRHGVGPNHPIRDLLDRIEDKRERALATSLAMEDRVWSYEGCLKLIDQFEMGVKNPERRLLREIRESEARGDDAKVMQLLAEKQKYAHIKAQKKQNCIRGR